MSRNKEDPNIEPKKESDSGSHEKLKLDKKDKVFLARIGIVTVFFIIVFAVLSNTVFKNPFDALKVQTTCGNGVCDSNEDPLICANDCKFKVGQPNTEQNNSARILNFLYDEDGGINIIKLALFGFLIFIAHRFFTGRSVF